MKYRRSLGIGNRFLNRPTTGGVARLDERVALAGENINEWVGLVLADSRCVAVAVAINDQTAISRGRRCGTWRH